MKLVLFDLDGTLISQQGASKHELNNGSDNKFAYALNKAFGISVSLDFTQFKGSIDRKTLWLTAEHFGITQSQFDDKFPQLCEYMWEYFDQQVKDINFYKTISDARDLVSALNRISEIKLGLLTGNIPLIAAWKMEQANVGHFFRFGLFGDEADDRISLARKVFAKAKTYFGWEFKPTDITVIGDTIHDVRCGKAIGAYTIAVTALDETAKTFIKAEHPDILVRSLADPLVYKYFHLPLH